MIIKDEKTFRQRMRVEFHLSMLAAKKHAEAKGMTLAEAWDAFWETVRRDEAARVAAEE
jgi:hypothetical protein